MLADSQKYIKLDPTMRAVNLLTEFIVKVSFQITPYTWGKRNVEFLD
jgi:hypothetical protein